jgi:RimJ/RimL family protein N-acetyltransferase
MAAGAAKVLETERLVVRRATADDVELYCELWNEPRVMGNVGFPHGLRVTKAQVTDLIQEQDDSAFDCLLVVELKGQGQTIGECKLGTPDEQGIAETDVKLLPSFWGHKYGVEIKRGLVDYLFTHTGCAAVQATPNVGNIASIKMQEAVGGVRVGEDVFEFPESMRDFTAPVHCYIYRVYREAWENAQNVRCRDDVSTEG